MIGSDEADERVHELEVEMDVDRQHLENAIQYGLRIQSGSQPNLRHWELDIAVLTAEIQRLREENEILKLEADRFSSTEQECLRHHREALNSIAALRHYANRKHWNGAVFNDETNCDGYAVAEQAIEQAMAIRDYQQSGGKDSNEVI